MCLQIYVYSYVSLLYIYKLRYVIVCVYLDMIKQLRTGLLCAIFYPTYHAVVLMNFSHYARYYIMLV